MKQKTRSARITRRRFGLSVAALATCSVWEARAIARGWPTPGQQPAAPPKAPKREILRSSSAQPWGHLGQGCTFSHAGLAPGGGMGISIYSGSPVVDRAYQAEGEKLIRLFGVTPAGGFMDDGRSPNAFATTDRIFTNSYNGTIIFGRSLLRRELSRDYGRGISIPAIMAHEFGHVVQFQEGSLSDAATPVRELHADFLAGWYLSRLGLSDRQVQPAMRAFYEMGDTAFRDPDHHGTPDERLASITAGFNSSADDIDEAFREGLDHVSG
jgi:hypothetical protein